jgi:hypothetical protein
LTGTISTVHEVYITIQPKRNSTTASAFHEPIAELAHYYHVLLCI